MAQQPTYTAQLSALVEPAVKDEIDGLADTYSVWKSEVIRDIVAAGLPLVRKQYARTRVAVERPAPRKSTRKDGMKAA